MIIHYEENQQEKRALLHSTGDFASSALCGNGNAHAKLTRERKQVTCKACKYTLGDYKFTPPPVSAHLWTIQDWINYIDSNGVWL